MVLKYRVEKSWLNADDLYYKNAVLNVVNEMQNKNFSWINGRYSKIKEDKLMQMSFPYFTPKIHTKRHVS